jgi:hypothetical protein
MAAERLLEMGTVPLQELDIVPGLSTKSKGRLHQSGATAKKGMQLERQRDTIGDLDGAAQRYTLVCHVDLFYL